MILRFSSSLLRVMYVLLMYFFFLCTQYISEDGGARFNERSLQSLLILAKDIPQPHASILFMVPQALPESAVGQAIFPCVTGEERQ